MSDVGFNVNVAFDNKALKKLLKTNESAMRDLCALILAHSNKYIPKQTGALEKSGTIHSYIGKGEIVWEAPYAHKQYYFFPNKRKNRNPFASGKWFECAKSKHLKNWLAVLAKKYLGKK